jgi:hypothetical protein
MDPDPQHCFCILIQTQVFEGQINGKNLTTLHLIIFLGNLKSRFLFTVCLVKFIFCWTIFSVLDVDLR